MTFNGMSIPYYVSPFVCQWTLELLPRFGCCKECSYKHGCPHFILNVSSSFSLLSGPDSWEVACEVVRSRMYQLLQVLQQEWCLELRSVNVGGIFLWAETISGKLLLFYFLIIWPSEQISTKLSLQGHTYPHLGTLLESSTVFDIG